MQSHVTTDGPVQILPKTFDERLRRKTLEVGQPEGISLEFQDSVRGVCLRIMPTKRNEMNRPH